MTDRPVVILGAGATKACGGPLTNEILPKAFQAQEIIEREEYLEDLEKFLIENFHLPEFQNERHPFHFPPLPLLMSLLDTAIDHKHNFSREWPVEKLLRVRSALEYVIFAVLQYELEHIDHKYYEDFLYKFMKGTNEIPNIVSLNYDIIIDNTLIIYGENCGPGENFPDYGCDIATEWYNRFTRFGKLYKVHGSLNWLYCPACHRLDVGISKSGRRTGKVLESLYHEEERENMDLEYRYTCKGSPCLDCGSNVRPVMITPTHMKDYRNPHIAQVWYNAERALKKSNRAIIIGYSLPENDVDVIYLLKRGLAHLESKYVTVIGHDKEGRDARDHPIGSRYCTIFGDEIDWHPEGFAGWLDKLGT
ncbi:MAG: hypothetical protein JSW07_08075 [bacterium]|nr:MAG: hypothetical protein JSW07_08075 [bacterium]